MTSNYLYDHRNQLIAAGKHGTDGGTLQLKVQYKYDALDNRIERTEDSDGDGNVDVTERFGYSQFTLAPGGEGRVRGHSGRPEHEQQHHLSKAVWSGRR